MQWQVHSDHQRARMAVQAGLCLKVVEQIYKIFVDNHSLVPHSLGFFSHLQFVV